MLVLAIIIAALVGIALAVLFEPADHPHPDMGRIQWPVPVDPTITIERRSS